MDPCFTAGKRIGVWDRHETFSHGKTTILIFIICVKQNVRYKLRKKKLRHTTQFLILSFIDPWIYFWLPHLGKSNEIFTSQNHKKGTTIRYKKTREGETSLAFEKYEYNTRRFTSFIQLYTKWRCLLRKVFEVILRIESKKCVTRRIAVKHDSHGQEVFDLYLVSLTR